jgi:long-chain acyl-CoA synthetase
MADDESPGYGPPAQARQRPDAPAIIVDGTVTTYRQFDAKCREVAWLLRAQGVEAGDRVSVMLGNSLEWFVAVHGIGRIGAIAVPVNTHFKEGEALHVLRDSGSAVLLTDPDRRAIIDVAVRDGCQVGFVTPGGASAWGDVRRTSAPIDDDDALVGDGWPTTMLYTSGTTGQPKGVAIGEGDFRRSAAGIAMMGSRWKIGPDDRYLLVGPAYHAGPAIWAQVHLAVGGTVVVMRRWDAEELLRLVERHRVTITHLVPANFIRLLELPDGARANADLSSLRLVLHAAAPCPVPVKRQIMTLFPDDTVWEYYGASEGGGTSISPREWLERPGSVGRPYPGNEFRITDDDGHVCAPNQAGTIWVRTAGSGSSFTYHNDPEKTASTYRDDWFSVGDVGYLDEEGYLFLTDRKSDMVISGGVNIYPREIENCLYEHPDVVDCAVFGIPDDVWGESIVAVVEPAPGSGLDAAAVVEWCRSHLADYKKPRRVELVPTLPRDPNGKVVKRLLRDELLARDG